ncbi:MAG: penicillin-binding protein [Actinobacteria bacterium]|nr:MAG: penicillin-binding protein [Actinomycetota bacterium]
MRPSFGDPSNSAQGRARVPGTGGGYDPDAVPGPPPGRAPVGAGTGGVGSAPVGGAPPGRASATGRASVGRASAAAPGTFGAPPDLVPGAGGPSGPGGDGPGGPAGGGPGRKGPRSKKARRRNIILASLAVFIMLAGGAVVGGGYYFDSVKLPNDIPLPQSSVITYADGKTPMAKLGDTNRTILPDNQIPDILKKAVVATEDQTFYTNHGVDLRGIIRAGWNNVTGGDTQGASTITQQYVRKAFDLEGVSYARKLREAVMAMKIDQSYSKDQILGFYLNTVYFGQGAYGIEAAAESYFGKDAKDLTPAEAMVLAAVIKDPEGANGFNPNKNLVNAKDRWTNYVKPSMVKLGYLSQPDADKLVYPTNIRKPDTTSAGQYGKDTPTAFVVHHVMDELLYHTNGRFTAQDLKSGGYTITTTIDKRYEDAAIKFADATQQGSPLAGQPARLQAALVSIEPRTGRVMAYFGGHNGAGLDAAGVWRDPVLQNDTDCGPNQPAPPCWYGEHFSPGSTFKMYTLATALSQKYSIDSQWYGPASRTFPGRGADQNGKPTKATPPVTNDEGDACPKSNGSYCTLQQALKLSTNTVYYAVGLAAHPDKVIDMAHAMGIQHLWNDVEGKRYDLSDQGDGTTTWTGPQLFPSHISPEVAIGQYGITVQDNATGVATIANGGVHVDTHFVEKVTRGGQTVYAEAFPTTKLASTVGLTQPEIADETWAMSTVIENSGGKNKLAGGRPGASKTGTWEACAQRNQCPDHPDWVGKNRDAWYAGFTPQLATVVHIGSTDPKNVTIGYYQGGSKKESNMFGINLPGDIWKKFMDSVLNGQPKKGFPDAPRVGDTDKGDPLAPSPPPPSNPPDGNGNQDGNGNGNLPPCTPPNVPPACIPTPSNPVPLPSQSKHG